MPNDEKLAILRIPVRRLVSGVTHLADVPVNHPTWIASSFGVRFSSPVGPLTTLCSVTLSDTLVHMQGPGTRKSSPHACRTCSLLNDRDPRVIQGAATKQELEAQL